MRARPHRALPFLCALGAALAALLGVAGFAWAQMTPPPVLWSGPSPVDASPIDAVACPAANLCVAVDRAGDVLSSSDPAGGASTWRSADVDGDTELTDVACPTISLCVAVDAGGNVLSSTDPAGGASAWQSAAVDTGSNKSDSDTAGDVLLRGISCPSAGLCVAVDADGDAYVSTDPTGGASAWTSGHADTNRRVSCNRSGLVCQPPLVGVSCPSSVLCAAADFSGNLLTTTDPTADAAWASTSTDGHGLGSLWGISCPTTSFCATVNGSADDVITFDPSDPGTRHTTALGASADGIWCRSASLCVASAQTSGGLAVTLASSDPDASKPVWSESPLGDLQGVACPTATLCVGVDGSGGVAAGVPGRREAQVLWHELLSTAKLPTVRRLSRRRSERFAVVSPIAARIQLVWTVTTSDGALLKVASGDHSFSHPGASTLVLRLTGAGRREFRAATRGLAVHAAASLTTDTGSVTRTRTLRLAQR